MKKSITSTILILIISAIFSLGCKVLKSNVVSEKSDPKETYLNALKKLNEAKFFNMEENLPEYNQNKSIKFIAPDKMTRYFISKSDNISSNTIWIGKTTYDTGEVDSKALSQTPYQKREEVRPIEMKDNLSAVLGGLYSRVEKGQVTDVVFLSKENIDGKEVFSYMGPSRVVISVSPDTGLPIQIVEKDGSKRTLKFDYDKEPKIEVPTNVK